MMHLLNECDNFFGRQNAQKAEGHIRIGVYVLHGGVKSFIKYKIIIIKVIIIMITITIIIIIIMMMMLIVIN